MHDIEPYYKWRNYYIASEDKLSPFHGREYDEFQFTQKIYNYFIHPQWDYMGSATLYIKILYVDYEDGIAMIELIGEWNDAIGNDIMFFKREIVDWMLRQDINKFILLCDNVLNFHGDEDCYYEEWQDDVADEGGWICLVNLQEHVMKEMEQTCIQHYVYMSPDLNEVNWRLSDPRHTIDNIRMIMDRTTKQLYY